MREVMIMQIYDINIPYKYIELYCWWLVLSIIIYMILSSEYTLNTLIIYIKFI